MIEDNTDDVINLRLPLDLLLIHDVDELENALKCEYAYEHESEIFFCRTKENLNEEIEELGVDSIRYYCIDDIEYDRIQAIVDLLNRAEEDTYLGHLLDRIVR